MGFCNSGLASTTTALGTAYWIALGTGTTAFAKTQTTLITESAASGLARAAATVTQQTTTAANDTLQGTKTFTSAATATISEVGLFDAASVGNMYSRTVLSPTKSVTTGDTLTVTIKLIYAN
jgi:FtsP/CotA-like multicopper oxidase with cupredoxin domain